MASVTRTQRYWPLISGGPNPTSTLTFRATDGIGVTGADIIFQVGTAGAIEAMRLYNEGTVRVLSGLYVGQSAKQSSALLAVRGAANAFEWGHDNAAGYLHTLGEQQSGSGSGFLAFFAEHGTNASTYRTRGHVGVILEATPAGALNIGHAVTGTSDNQALTTRLSMSSTGALTATVSLAAPILAVGAASTTTGALHLFNAASAIKLVLQSAALAAADRIVTFPDPGGADSVVYAALAQTLTNKTLTNPFIALLVGGTTTTSTLTYKTTTAAGAAGADHIFLVGNNGATEAARILNAGSMGLGTSVPNFIATAGTKAFSVKGSTGAGTLEMMTAEADASGVVLGRLVWSDINGAASNPPVFMRAVLSGATAGNRGGQLEIYTKPNNASVALAATFTTTQGLVLVGGMQVPLLHVASGVATANQPIAITAAVDGNVMVTVQNTSTGTSAQSNVRTVSNTGVIVQMGIYGSGKTAYGAILANYGYLYSAGHLVLMTDLAAGTISFATGGSAARWTIASTGGLWAAGATGSDPGAGKINAAGGYQVNGAAITHMLVTNHGGVLIPASTTYYSGFATIGMIATPEARVSNVMTKAGTISSLYITTSTAQPASGSMVCTVRKNGANTAVTLTIAASAAAGTFSDTTNSFTFVAGDLISIGFNNSATVSSAAIYGVSVNVTI